MTKTRYHKYRLCKLKCREVERKKEIEGNRRGRKNESDREKNTGSTKLWLRVVVCPRRGLILPL